MTNPEYVSLHTHTHYSMLDGFSKIDEYLDRAVELGHRGLGTSDHGNVFGVYELMKKSKARGIIGVPGCEFYVAPVNPEGARVREPIFYGPGGRKAGGHDVASNGSYLHITVWAYNTQGLHNLFKLSTMSNDPSHFKSKPRIDFDMLADHSEGLIVSTGCPSSEISTRFLLGQKDKAYEYAGRLKEVFGDRLYIEIMDHGMSIDLERTLLPQQLELSKHMGIPLLATNDSHYAHAGDVTHHEEMLCTQSGARMSDETYDNGGPRFAFNGDQYYLKSAEEMDRLFPEDEFPNALKSSLVIAEMAQDIHLDFDPHLKPKPIIPEGYTEVSYYKHLLDEGFKLRYGTATEEVKTEAKKRVRKEFEVIHSSDFIGYMLTVQEYMVWTRDNFSTLDEDGKVLALPVGVGRGSIGGSIHAYLLYISELDPIKHDLIFERFLSAGRGATYKLTYDDGTSEEIPVSDEKQVTLADGRMKKRYIHQLNVDDEVTI